VPLRTSCGSPASASIGCPFAEEPAVSMTFTALPLLVRSGDASFVFRLPAPFVAGSHQTQTRC
jgi:hypothetical protein